jgi:hypothetical protein
MFSGYITQIASKEATMKEPVTPQGTIALLLVYLVIVIALWGNAYLTVLSRGGTQ